VILTLTPNPTIDRVVFVRGFRLGATIRAEREMVTPSGKGVDASLVIHELGGETVALGLDAGITGQLHRDLLDRWGVRHDFCEALGETRTATVLVDLDAEMQSTISAPTLRAIGSHLTELVHAVGRHAEGAWGLICGGSLPPGLPTDSYARLIRSARERGLFVLLDTSGEALARGMEVRPHVVKVNAQELGVVDPQIVALVGEIAEGPDEDALGVLGNSGRAG